MRDARTANLLTVASAVAVASVADDDVAWLGWHRRKRLDAAGTHLTGPYTTGQVAGLILVGVVIAAIGGAAGYAMTTAAAGAIATLVWFSIAWSTEPGGDGLWPIGVLLATAATLTFASLVARAAQRFHGTNRG